MADTPDISELIGKLVSDEKFGEVLRSVKESISANAEDPSSSPEQSQETAKEPANTPTENPIPSIPTLSPELIAKLPEIMGMLSSGGSDKKPGSRMEDRKRLLSAMKPFLSERRRAAVDSIVNIAGIADLFGI